MIAGRRFGPSKTTPSKSRLFAVVGALALFTVASLACGFAQSQEVLVIADVDGAGAHSSLSHASA